MKGFLQYLPGDSLLHRLDPLAKLVLSVLFCTAAFISPSVIYVSMLLIVILLTCALCGIGKSALSLFSLLLKLSLILFVIQVFFVSEGKVLLSLPLNLVITDSGVLFSLLIALRLMVAALPLALMITVTPMSHLVGAMVQKLRIPYKYAFSLTTAIRFIPIFSSEMAEIIETQTARGVDLDTKNIFKKTSLIIPLAIPLLISSVKKTEYIALSAELRGFSLRSPKSGYKDYTLKRRDAAALLVGALLVTMAFFVSLP